MDIFDKIELQDCPICGGAGLLEEENGNSFYVACMDCGSRSVNIDYKEEAGREDAAQRVYDSIKKTIHTDIYNAYLDN